MSLSVHLQLTSISLKLHVSTIYFLICLPFWLQSFLYLAWYMTMSILGHYNNFFFAAHLLDIAMGFKTLRTILSSVTHNGKQVNDYKPAYFQLYVFDVFTCLR